MALPDKKAYRLTKNQSLVLDALTNAKQPLGAYSLLDCLHDHGLKAPLQVYRTLDQLAELGLVHRLESLNAWTICCAHTHEGAPIFAICDDCGKVTEHIDKQFAQNIEILSKRTGFSPKRSIIEIYGACDQCRAP